MSRHLAARLSCAKTCPEAETVRLLGLGADLLDDLAVLHQFGLDEFTELLGRVACGVGSECVQSLLQAGGRQSLHEFRVEAFYDGARRPGRRQHAIPPAGLI